MKNTVKIYEIFVHESLEANGEGYHYSLAPWGDNTKYYKGSDDGGLDYILPDGYTVAEDVTGTMQIWNEKGEHCELVGRKYPAIVDVSKGDGLRRLARLV